MPLMQGNHREAGDNMPRGIVKNAWVNSPQADEVARYYTDGHTVRETAEKFGVTKVQVNNLVKKRHLTNGVYWKNGAVKSNENRSKDAEQRIGQYIDSLGFQYLGGYTNKKGYVNIKCKTCNTKYKRTYEHIRTGNVICLECQKRQTQERQAKEKEIARQNAEMRKLERDWMRLLNHKEDHFKKLHQEFLNRTGICEICGKEYSVRDYVESANLKYAIDNGVCSAECRKEKKRILKRRFKTSNHIHRSKKYGVAYESGITLRKLIARDGLTCAICGGECDLNDHSWSDYAGAMYPSIDHIIPLSKGGTHTWDNVQVTHMICNSLKSDSIEKVVSL